MSCVKTVSDAPHGRCCFCSASPAASSFQHCQRGHRDDALRIAMTVSRQEERRPTLSNLDFITLYREQLLCAALHYTTDKFYLWIRSFIHSGSAVFVLHTPHKLYFQQYKCKHFSQKRDIMQPVTGNPSCSVSQPQQNGQQWHLVLLSRCVAGQEGLFT